MYKFAPVKICCSTNYLLNYVPSFELSKETCLIHQILYPSLSSLLHLRKACIYFKKQNKFFQKEKTYLQPFKKHRIRNT